MSGRQIAYSVPLALACGACAVVLGWDAVQVLPAHAIAVEIATWPVAGADALGAFDGAYGTLGFRWKVATGEARPAFP